MNLTRTPYNILIIDLKAAICSFLLGSRAEDESGGRGAIRHLGDFAGQCRYGYEKLKRLLAALGETFRDGNL